jgi:D-alanine-D-alanine ligase
MKRKHIAILRGGPSEEYEVSLRTGAGVLASLRETDYVTHDIIITKDGEWLVSGRVRTPEQALTAIDGVFIALHGSYGEDGTVQRLLDRLGIPYTGSGAYASAIAMNKVLTKNHVKDLGFKLAPHIQLEKSAVYDTLISAHGIANQFGPTYVVKPLRGGSSIGTIIATGTTELADALERSFAVYDEVLVEQWIQGKEATIGVIEGYRGQDIYCLPVIEIVPPPAESFFTLEAKYSGTTEEICPARFSHAQKQAIEQVGADVHRALGLRHYSRTDVILSGDDVYFLEVNTLPGLTQESLIPNALKTVGSTYDEFILHILEQALA